MILRIGAFLIGLLVICLFWHLDCQLMHLGVQFSAEVLIAAEDFFDVIVVPQDLLHMDVGASDVRVDLLLLLLFDPIS